MIEGEREREKKKEKLIERGKTGRPRSMVLDSRGKRAQLATKKTTDQQGERESRSLGSCLNRAFRAATGKPPKGEGEGKKKKEEDFDRKRMGEWEAGSKDGKQQAFQQGKLFQKIGH